MEQKKTPGEIIIGGVVLLILGIIICVSSGNRVSYAYSSFSRDDSWTSIGSVMILIGMVTIGVGAYRYRSQSEDDESGPAEDFSERLEHEKKPAPAPAPIPAVKTVETTVVKKIVYCPYCGTAQKEDYLSCDSCGAGRKK